MGCALLAIAPTTALCSLDMNPLSRLFDFEGGSWLGTQLVGQQGFF